MASSFAATLVSNFNQGSDTAAEASIIRGQGFTTGNDLQRYTLSAVKVGSEDADGDSFTVSVCTADSDGYPTSTCTELLPPSDFAAGVLTFTAPANTILDANTTYIVLITVTATDGRWGEEVALDMTSSDGEDAGKATGWSIADGYVWYSSGESRWRTTINEIRIAIDGDTDDKIDIRNLEVTSTPRSSTADTYGVGEKIQITATFEDDVTVKNSTPQIEIKLGNSGQATPRRLNDVRGTGTTELVFEYTVVQDDKDNDGIWLEENPLKLNGANIRDRDDNDVRVDYRALLRQENHKVNGSLPSGNNPPPASDNTVTTDEDKAYIFAPSDFNFEDADISDSLTSVKIVSVETAGALELSGAAVTANEVIAYDKINNGELVFRPADDAHGIPYATFTFKVNDGLDDSTAAYTMTINVDSTPEVTNVEVTSTPLSGTADPKDTYGVGETIQVTVTFDENMTVRGAPVFEIQMGDSGDTATTKEAAYMGGLGSTALVFAYTVLASDTDDDGIEIAANALQLNSGTIRDDDANAADLDHEQLGGHTGHKVDGSLRADDAPPRVTLIERQEPDTSPTNADSLTWRVTFSEDVQNVDATDFTVSGTTATLSLWPT